MSDGIRITTNNFQYAAPQKRLLAWLIDFAIVNFLLLLFVPGFWVDWSTYVGQIFAGTAHPAVFVTSQSFIIFAVAPIIYLSLLGGFMSRTFGMMVAKIRIANLDGSKISWAKAVLRAVFFEVFFLLICLGFLPVLFDKKRQGLHDKLSRTMVIIKR